jgi:ubiquinone/menaquinone biosynthesis C-methylase UbiE
VALFEELMDQGLVVPGGRVLELGCGGGTYVRLLGKRGHPVVGLDYSLPTLARAQGADSAGFGRYIAGSAYALPFESGAFQAVICIGVLQVLDRPDLAIAEMVRVLGARGVLLVETLNPWNLAAVVRRLIGWLQRRPSRLQLASAERIEQIMLDQNLRPLKRVEVILPPRSWSGLSSILQRPGVRRVLERVPWAGRVVAHAFWLVGIRS